MPAMTRAPTRLDFIGESCVGQRKCTGCRNALLPAESHTAKRTHFLPGRFKKLSSGAAEGRVELLDEQEKGGGEIERILLVRLTECARVVRKALHAVLAPE